MTTMKLSRTNQTPSTSHPANSGVACRAQIRSGQQQRSLASGISSPAVFPRADRTGNSYLHVGRCRAINAPGDRRRSEEHTSELQSLMRISYAVFCLKKKKKKQTQTNHNKHINST